MNFSWIIDGKLAGSMGPVNRQQLLHLKDQGVGAVIRMEHRTVSAEEVGLVDMAELVADFAPPTLDQIDRMIAFIDSQIAASTPVAVSCQAGVGRTGTVLACYLVHTGYDADDAIAEVRRLRPRSVEAPGQVEAVYQYQERLRRASGAVAEGS
jgi:atypical dual specificity phosphatase